MWLLIETICFYVYTLACVIYIMRHQCKGWFRANKISDLKKQTSDFIIYSQENMSWFAINLILCTVPPIVVFKTYYSFI